MDEIQQTFGVPVDYYIHVDLKGFIAWWTSWRAWTLRSPWT